MPVSISSGGVNPHRFKVPNYEGAATTDAPEDVIPQSGPVVLIQTHQLPKEYGPLPAQLELDLSRVGAEEMEDITQASGGDRIARLVALAKVSQQRTAVPAPPVFNGRQTGRPSMTQARPAQPVVAAPHTVDPSAEDRLREIAGSPVPGPREVKAPDQEVIFVTPIGNFSAWYHDVYVSESIVVLTFDTRARGSTAFMPSEQNNSSDPDAPPTPIVLQIPHLRLELRCLVQQPLRWEVQSQSLLQCLLLVVGD